MRKFSEAKEKETDCVDMVNISIDMIDLGVAVHHQLAVTDSLTEKNRRQPILFRIVTPGSSETYAWWPLENRTTATRILNALYATLVFSVHDKNQKEEHRTLVDAILVMMADYKESMITRDKARLILTRYFDTYELGSMKRVRFHGQGDNGVAGEIDFYFLPVKVSTYTWLGL